MANLQVKDIDPLLYDALRHIAKREHRSISQEVIKIIETYINMPNIKQKNATEEFLKLAGSWDDDRSADEIANEIRRSRREGERFNNGIFD